MTMKLLEVAKKVIAVELDPRMVLELQRRVQNTPYVNHLQVCISCISQSECLFFSFGNRFTIDNLLKKLNKSSSTGNILMISVVGIGFLLFF
jgi:hypothetical protein